MTMNWFVAESLIEQRQRDLVHTDERRWPDIGHARRSRLARRGVAGEPRAARR